MNHQPKPSLSICHTKKTHKHMHLLSLAGEHKKNRALPPCCFRCRRRRHCRSVFPAVTTCCRRRHHHHRKCRTCCTPRRHRCITVSVCSLKMCKQKILLCVLLLLVYFSPTMKPWRSLLCETHEHKHTNVHTQTLGKHRERHEQRFSAESHLKQTGLL